MKTYFESTTSSKLFENGKLKKKSGLNVSYDGNQLDVDVYDNKERIYMQLDNDELGQLISLPSSKHTLEERLRHDFPLVKHKSQHKKKSHKIKSHKRKSHHKKTKSPKHIKTRKKSHHKRENKSYKRESPPADIEKTIY